MVPVLEMKLLRLREVKLLAQHLGIKMVVELEFEPGSG